ncbi:MAG: hypothetical protein ABI690_05595 [Chloroflexota bacterium]
MMRKLLVILFAICLGIVPALAQDSQPNQGFILGTSSEVIFPQAVRFSVNVSRGFADLASASLIIQPEGQSATVVTVDLGTAAIVRDPYTQLDYIWPIPSANPPRLFQKLTFTWRVISTADESSEYENSLVFSDQRATWFQEVDSTGNLSLTMPDFATLPQSAQISQAANQSPATPLANSSAGDAVQSDALAPTATSGGAEAVTPLLAFTPSGPQPTTDSPVTNSAQQVRYNLQPVYDLLAANTGRKPSFNLLIYSDSFTPGCTPNSEGKPVAVAPFTGNEIPCENAIASAIVAASGYELLQSDSNSLNRIQAAVISRLVDRFYEAAWQGKVVPAWFRLGLQEFYSPSLKGVYYPTLVTAARNGTLLTLDQLGSSGANVDLATAQSYGLTLYLADEFGLPGLYKLANVDSDSFANAYQTLTGKPLSSLLDDWKSWIFSNQAVSAFSVTAYQMATPTPTATRTPTSTWTPTPTSTFTPTITPTLTGTLSPTPIPPTRLLTQPPATRTPRPAGSLNTPTPVPTKAPVSPIGTLNTPSIAIGILTIGLIIIAVFALFLLRGRNTK